MDYTQIATRIKKDVQLILVQTTLGTAVKITKKEALKLLATLEARNVEAKIEFSEIYNGRYLVTIN